MDLMKLGTELLKNYLGDKVSSDAISGALGNLLGGGSNNLDIGSLMALMNNGDLMSMASSWLGDGDNQTISPDQIRNLLGGDKVSNFASDLGVDEDSAVGGLSDMLPKLVDQSSSGGSLLDSVGGVGGALNMAKGLFS